jgi:hypothetical protein
MLPLLCPCVLLHVAVDLATVEHLPWGCSRVIQARENIDSDMAEYAL